MPYSGVNLAPFPNYWVTDQGWHPIPYPPVFLETNSSLQYLNNPTYRIDPPPATNATSPWDAMDFTNNLPVTNTYVPVQAGDHMYFEVMLKAGGTTPVNQEGAWPALDYYTAGAGMRINGMDTAYCASIGQSWPQYNDPNKDNAFLHWATNWTRMSWDWNVPATALRDSDGDPYPIGCFIPWIQRQGTQGSIWASQYVLYKNPTGSPGGTQFPLTISTKTLLSMQSAIHSKLPKMTMPSFNLRRKYGVNWR